MYRRVGFTYGSIEVQSSVGFSVGGLGLSTSISGPFLSGYMLDRNHINQTSLTLVVVVHPTSLVHTQSMKEGLGEGGKFLGYR